MFLIFLFPVFFIPVYFEATQIDVTLLNEYFKYTFMKVPNAFKISSQTLFGYDPGGVLIT